MKKGRWRPIGLLTGQFVNASCLGYGELDYKMEVMLNGEDIEDVNKWRGTD